MGLEKPTARDAAVAAAPDEVLPRVLSEKPGAQTASKPPPLVPLVPLPPAPARADCHDPARTADAKRTDPARQAEPMVRLVNTKRITLNFEVKDVGPSGVSAVQLWYTQDGKEWHKHDAPPKKSSYLVEVDDEGMYGFTLVARNGIGLGNDPPRPGDQPQVWVVVDTTKPAVQLGEATPGTDGKSQTVAIRWTARDRNLGRHPITLSYAEKEQGPWKTICSDLENSGMYLWRVPAGAPGVFLVRVEATDLAGNVGRGQSPRPVVLDSSRPTVSIIAVEPGR
jgi:hypothetical protein